MNHDTRTTRTPNGFWEKVRVGPTESCWQWLASKSSAGYGQVHTGRLPSGNSRMQLAHRIAYEETIGAIPDGLDLDHLCRNRSCVNPSHLEPVTRGENVRRGADALTHCRHGHEWTDESTYRAPSTGYRQCRLCVKEFRRSRRPKAS